MSNQVGVESVLVVDTSHTRFNEFLKECVRDKSDLEIKFFRGRAFRLDVMIKSSFLESLREDMVRFFGSHNLHWELEGEAI